MRRILKRAIKWLGSSDSEPPVSNRWELGRISTSATFITLLAACTLVSCSSEPPAAPQPANLAAPPPSVALHVLVVNEPELAAAIGRLRGEWRERFGGNLLAETKTWQDVAAADAIDADLIVFPTRYLGKLATRGWLRPVRKNVLDSADYDAADVFPLARRDLVTWGGQVMALPISIDLPTEGLLVRVAPAALSNDRQGVLFDPETMRPRIAEPAFVQALSMSNDAAELGSVPVLGVDDRLLAVTTASRNPATAFRLLGWLASAEISTQLASAVGGPMPIRHSLAKSSAWYDPRLNAAERNELAIRLEQALNSDRCLLVPRIPGIDDYLAALDEAAASVQAGNAEPLAALEAASTKWDAITDLLGRDKQRAAYLKHLNITEP